MVSGQMVLMKEVWIGTCWRSEVTPGFLAGAEPKAHQFNVTIYFKG